MFAFHEFMVFNPQKDKFGTTVTSSKIHIVIILFLRTNVTKTIFSPMGDRTHDLSTNFLAHNMHNMKDIFTDLYMTLISQPSSITCLSNKRVSYKVWVSYYALLTITFFLCKTPLSHGVKILCHKY